MWEMFSGAQQHAPPLVTRPVCSGMAPTHTARALPVRQEQPLQLS